MYGVDEHEEAELFSSAARTATTNGADQNNVRHRGVQLVLDITAVSGTAPTLDVKVQCKDDISDKYVDIPGAAFAQKTAAGTDRLLIYPGVAETANKEISDILPKRWRVVATIGGTTPSFTFSLGAQALR